MRRIQLFSYENALLLLMGVTFGIVFFDRTAVSILMPFIQPDLHLTNVQVGFVTSALSLTWSVFNIVSGRVSDTMGRRKPLLIGAVIVFSLCSFVSGLATSFAMLIGARLFMGVAEGPVPPLTVAILADGSSSKRRGLNSGLFIAFGPLIAGVIAPIVLIALAQGLGWRAAFYLSMAPGLIAAVLIWRFVRERAKRPATEPRPVALPDAAPAARDEIGDKPLPILDIIRTRNVWLCTVIISCLMGGGAASTAFFTLYFVQTRHMDASTVGFILSAQGVASIITLCVLPALSDRIGRKPVVAFFTFVGAIGPAAILFFHGATPILIVLLMVATTSGVAAPLVIMAIPSESVPARSVGTAVGFVPGVGEFAGSFVGPIAAGWIADQTSPAAPFVIALVCTLAGGFAALFLKETLPSKVGLAHPASAPAVAPAAIAMADEPAETGL